VSAPEQGLNAVIVLTDDPAVVALKREFRDLDQREEELKRSRGRFDTIESHEMQVVRGRKSEIAREIFALEGGQ
jgi:hypothetical protein